MAKRNSEKIIKVLLRKYGRTFSEELGINLESDSPTALFRWLCASLLFSTRISHKIAIKAAKALFQQGWTSAQKMLEATWKQRTIVLNRSGYARYDEKTSRTLADVSRYLLSRYHGDLRKLRTIAKCNPRREKQLIMEYKGIGEVGASIFFREIQGIWKENVPFVDRLVSKSARKLGLPTDGEDLKKLVPKEKFLKLLAALVRCSLAKDFSDVLREARQS